MGHGRPFKLSAARPPKGRLRTNTALPCAMESAQLMACWKKNDFVDSPCAQLIAKLAECMTTHVRCLAVLCLRPGDG
jgi:hypothetical protein